MKNKPFDCVTMKNEIQAKLLEEHKGLSDDEIARRRKVWLETSNDPLAAWWRTVSSSAVLASSAADTAASSSK